MTSLKISSKVSTGIHLYVSPPMHNLKYIHFSLINLEKNDKVILESEGKESVLIPLEGFFEIQVDSESFGKVGRSSPFVEPPDVIVIPPNSNLKINNMKAKSQIAIVSSPGKGDFMPSLISKYEIKSFWRGTFNWRRKIRNLLPEDSSLSHLIIGETINPPGFWSSVPPHKHDTMDPPEKIALEEIYFFKVFPKQGFGIQWIYTDDTSPISLDEVYVVRDSDLIVIPAGYHPVVAGPGYSLYYLWVLAGPIKRMPPLDFDKTHRWILDCESILKYTLDPFNFS